LRSYNLTANVSALPQVGILKIVCPVEMLKRKMIIKLLKSLLEKVNPQTKADSAVVMRSISISYF